MNRTFDVSLNTRIPRVKPHVYRVRVFRTNAESRALAIARAINKARLHYITAPLPVVDVVEVRTLGVRLAALWRYLRPAKVEIASGDIVGLRAIVAGIVRRFS